jgi:DNA-3-methyladenine glycosylase
MKKLPLSFYRKDDVVEIAKKLLGKFLFTKIDNFLVGGMIIETESYSTKEKACHAYNNLLTKRTSAMFENGGVAYIYLCYGIHNMINVVTNKKNTPEAVLIRALKPIFGIDIMKKRNNSLNLTNGPGSLCKSLKICRKLNLEKLTDSKIWIENKNIKIDKKNIIKTKRIGVEYAKEDAMLPWRFKIKNLKQI